MFKDYEHDVTSLHKRNLNELDNNNGNLALIINNYTNYKKPIPDRKIINWGTAQSQRGKTSVYSCLGYFECVECDSNGKSAQLCKSCDIQFIHRSCEAKKYVYFCKNECIRELYKKCCEYESNDRKLVILYVEAHNCMSKNLLKEPQTVDSFKQVLTVKDILENVSTCIEEGYVVEIVSKVPSDINGQKYYILENVENLELKEFIRDGRKWKTYTQTTSQIFSNILNENTGKNVRKYRCSPQYFCYFPQCPFRKRFELVNQVNWKIGNDGERRCISCSEVMEMIKCNAEKYIVKSENSQFVLIKHIGEHNCLAKTTLETKILEEMEDFFEKNPTATRSEAIVHHLVNKINFGTQKEVIDLISISLNIWEINNLKAKGIRRLNPHGSKMEAIRHLKKKLEDIGNPFDIIIKVFDDIYICNICNFISESTESENCVTVCVSCSMLPMEHVGPSVFISSKDSLATLRELRVNMSLAQEACCLDHQPSRLRGYTTFAAYAYDLDIRKMCPLFASVMTNEKELSVYHSIDVADRCLQENFKSENRFDPNLIIADEASSIKNAIVRKLGPEKMQKQYGTCQLHFKGSVLQHASYVIGDKKEIWQFMKLSENLMNSETPLVYDLFKKEIVDFISKTENRHAHLVNWLKFYDSRKTGWSRAFRNPELPKTNKGEAGNAHYSAVTHLTGLTLDLGVKCMVAEFHVYAGCRRGIVTGQYRGGSGPSRIVMDNRMIKETFDRIAITPLTSEGAVDFVNKVLKQLGMNETENVALEPTITKQPSVLQTHKFLQEQIKARTEARVSSPSFRHTPDKAPKRQGKRKIQFTDTLEDMEIDQPRKKTKTTGETLDEKALNTLAEGFSIKTKDIGIYQITIGEDENRSYEIDLNNPSCTCPQFEKIVKARETDRNRDICKHVVVMRLCLGFTYGSSILRKYSYNASDRVLLNLKCATFSHKNVNIEEIKKKFEQELYPNLETEEPALPYFNPKKYYGQYDSYEEAKLFINEQKERYPCKWFGLKYNEKRYVCTSAVHTSAETKKLRPKTTQSRPLVFLAYFTRIYLNKNTGKYSAKDEKKYFHMQKSCISRLGSELCNFSNIQPPFDVDISRLTDENRELVKQTFPEYTFVEDFE